MGQGAYFWLWVPSSSEYFAKCIVAKQCFHWHMKTGCLWEYMQSNTEQKSALHMSAECRAFSQRQLKQHTKNLSDCVAFLLWDLRPFEHFVMSRNDQLKKRIAIVVFELPTIVSVHTKSQWNCVWNCITWLKWTFRYFLLGLSVFWRKDAKRYLFVGKSFLRQRSQFHNASPARQHKIYLNLVFPTVKSEHGRVYTLPDEWSLCHEDSGTVVSCTTFT